MPYLFAANELNAVQILSGLFGGLALFLFGLGQLTDSLKTVAGDGMRTLLARLTKNRFAAMFTGAFVTAVCQSSSITTVLLVGFISAGLMTLHQSVGVIMGANIGSTITAQLIAFKITEYGLPMVTVGFMLQFLSKREIVRQLGNILMGIGLIFFGMDLMSDKTSPLQDYEPFIETMRNMDNPMLAIIVAALATAIMQSSSATTGVIIVLAGQGFITLEAGIALAMGANIGTCVTALLAAIGKPRPAIRAAMVHVLFNVVGVIIWLPFLAPFADVVRALSPTMADLEGTARLAAETPRQIANAHSLFNVANAFIFIWFTGPIARFVERLVRDQRETDVQTVRPKFLDQVYLETPSLALDRVRMELGHLGQRVLPMIEAAPAAVIEGSRADLDRMREMDNDVDTLFAAVLTYVRHLSGKGLSTGESKRLQDLLTIANNLESTGDLVETNLVAQGINRIEYGLEFSPGTREMIRPLFEAVHQAVKDVLQALADDDSDLARQVVLQKPEIERLANAAAEHLSQRLMADEPNRIRAFQVETDIISQIKRVHYYARRIARVIVRENGELKER